MNLTLLEKICCPVCHHSPLNLITHDETQNLVVSGNLVCSKCGENYQIIEEIPVLLPGQLQNGSSNVEVSAQIQNKRAQIDHFNNIGLSELEIRRPHDCGKVYNFLLSSKLAIVSQLFGKSLENKSILDVCCGSGMDAEYLSRSGGKVLGIDISLGAVRGAKKRAQLFGLSYELMVADTEALPILDRSFDIAFVHDGLHHLDNPIQGLKEMARVTNQAILITEPASSKITDLSVRLKISDAVEESGNRVYRFKIKELISSCESFGFRTSRFHRYIMYYKQKPLFFFRYFEGGYMFKIFKWIYKFTNLTIGRWGNKIALVVFRN